MHEAKKEALEALQRAITALHEAQAALADVTGERRVKTDSAPYVAPPYVRAMVCTRSACRSEMRQDEDAPCPDCGSPCEWLLGECDCGAITDEPEIRECGRCSAYGNWVDNEIDARDMEDA
jgi:hypothetical protein